MSFPVLLGIVPLIIPLAVLMLVLSLLVLAVASSSVYNFVTSCTGADPGVSITFCDAKLPMFAFPPLLKSAFICVSMPVIDEGPEIEVVDDVFAEGDDNDGDIVVVVVVMVVDGVPISTVPWPLMEVLLMTLMFPPLLSDVLEGGGGGGGGLLMITMFVLIDPSVMGMSPQSVVAVDVALLLSVVLIRVIGADSGDVVVFCDDWPIVNGISWKSPLSPSSVVISSFASPNSGFV